MTKNNKFDKEVIANAIEFSKEQIEASDDDIIITEPYEGVQFVGTFKAVRAYVLKHKHATELIEDIEEDDDRNPALPPMVHQDWQGGRVNPTQYATPAKPAPERKVTVVIDNRPEDGIIHTRARGLEYPRRPSKVGGQVVLCKSWTAGEHDKLAGLVCHGNIDQLQTHLVKKGMPGKSTRKKVASALNRSESSVTAKLRDLRRKALVSGK